MCGARRVYSARTGHLAFVSSAAAFRFEGSFHATDVQKAVSSAASPEVVSQHRGQNARVKRPVEWLPRQIEVTACSYLCHSWVFVQAHSLEFCVCENGSVSGECGGRSGRVPLAQTLY
jgi:hypothetical protein